MSTVTGQSVWELPPSAVISPPQPPKEAPPPSTDELVYKCAFALLFIYTLSQHRTHHLRSPISHALPLSARSFLFEAISSMVKQADAAAEALCSKQRQLQAVLADSQKMQV